MKKKLPYKSFGNKHYGDCFQCHYANANTHLLN